ncbi:MAG: neutral/alkaline non-lysosomal ceramidase N-terminal domain-containing protein [Opitutaceae bacterium]|nr:neutral/alkaline non-lysosomal ceramidase N-terminal domain-containing protein [Opitutaceae bacterium]
MSSSHDSARAGLVAGAATADITPAGSVFLFGYPHVPRNSTGVHDPLECTALFVSDGEASALFLAHDLIFVPRELVLEARRRIAVKTGVREDAILLSATHTHSGPVLVDQIGNAADPVVPKPDFEYAARLLDLIVQTASRAVTAAEPAEVGLAVARAEGVGSNRHDPRGPADPEVPVLVARSVKTRQPLGCMVVYAMHPTVLHEDSTVISGDFPHFTRSFLRRGALPAGCPILYHNGASGNQSPRHFTRGNTLAEAQRLGENLGRSIASAIATISFTTEARVDARQGWVELEPRAFPGPGDAERVLAGARARFRELKAEGAAAPAVRTAECDVFGAEETAELARAAADGRLKAALAARTPAEIQAIRIGPWTFVGWPGEFFVEYALALKARSPRTHLITLANGELQGYIVTPDAAAQRRYEALNAVFAPENGNRFVEATLALLARGA